MGALATLAARASAIKETVGEIAQAERERLQAVYARGKEQVKVVE